MSNQQRASQHGVPSVVLIAVLGLAGLVRFQGLGEEDYWLDELHSLADSAGHRRELEEIPHGVILEPLPRYTDLTSDSSWRATWNTMAEDSHPPLYFLMLVTWRQLWGDGEFAVRWLTAVCSILSIVPVALIARRYGRERAAVWMALVLALAFAHAHMGRQARPYALGLFWVNVSFWLFVGLETNWRRYGRERRLLQLAAYAASIYLAALTHYFAVLPLLGQAVYAFIRLRGKLLRLWASAVLVAAATWAVTWGPQFLGQLEFIARQDWVREVRDDHVARTLMRLLDLPVRLLFNHELFAFHWFRIAIGGVALAAVIWLTYRYRRGSMLLFSLWFLVPVLAYLILDLTTDHQLLSHLRYASVVVPGLVGVIVLGLDRLPRITHWVVTCLLLLAMALAPDQESQRNPLSRETARLIAHEIKPGDLLIYDAVDWPPFWAARLYHLVSYYLHPPSRAFVLLREEPEPDLLQQMRTYKRLIVVSPRADGVPNPLPDLYEHTFGTDYIWGIGHIHLFSKS